jgi:hypothetical protein
MPRKELHYFDVKYRRDLPGHYLLKGKKASPKPPKDDEAIRKKSVWDPVSIRNGAAYKKYFQERVPEHKTVFGEITPAYSLIGEEGFGEIRGLFGKVRIIFTMRDPVARLFSQIGMQRSNRIRKGRDAQDAEQYYLKPGFLEKSMYELTISNLERVFQGNEIIYLFYETMFQEVAMRGLCDFIGIPYRAAEFEKVVRPGEIKEPVPDELRRQICGKLANTYEFCLRRFGDKLPKEWNYAQAEPQTS